MEKKKIIIIGATGNTGIYLVDYMINNLDLEQYEIVPVGRRKTDFFKQWGLSYCSVDITNKEDFNCLPKVNVHAVVFEAGLLPAAMKGYNPELYLKINTMGAFNVLEYCRKVKANRIIYTQTIREIGKYINTGVVLSPDLPRSYALNDDHAIYTISKIAAVDMIETYYNMYNLKRFVFRLPTIYSYGKTDMFYVDGVAKKKAYRMFMEKAERGEPIEIWGNPNVAHDVVYVKDFCQMLTKACIVDCDGGVYHVGTGKPVSLDDQIKGIVKVFAKDKESEIIYRPDKPNARTYTMDISNAVKDLGYEPKYSYLDYLKDFKKEMELNRFKDLFENI